MIDLLFVFLILKLLFYFLGNIGDGFVLLIWFIISTLYFTIIKSSNVKTLGYRLLGLRIVNLGGSKPSFSQMILRHLISLIGPFQLPYDIIWIVQDDQKQTLRDKFVGTYVIKSKAKPIFENKIFTFYYFVHGFLFLFEEVKHPNQIL